MTTFIGPQNTYASKSDAIETTVQQFKNQNYTAEQITANLIHNGLYDKEGYCLIEGIKKLGFSKGNMSDFYRYLNKAKKNVFKTNAKSDEIQSKRYVQLHCADRNAHEFLSDFSENTFEKGLQLSRYIRSGEELQQSLEVTRQELNCLSDQNIQTQALLRQQSEEMNQLRSDNNLLTEQFTQQKIALEENIQLLHQFRHILSKQKDKIVALTSDKLSLDVQLSERNKFLQSEMSLIHELKSTLQAQFEEKQHQTTKDLSFKLAQSDSDTQRLSSLVEKFKMEQNALKIIIQKLTTERDQLQADLNDTHKQHFEGSVTHLEQDYDKIYEKILEKNETFYEKLLTTLSEKMATVSKNLNEVQQKNYEDKINRVIAAIQSILRERVHRL